MPYYVFDDAKNKFEGMTREQIINAIASATGLTPAQVDDDIITTAIKEQNAQRSVNLWVGTQAEYNAIQQPAESTLYVVTDPDETEQLQSQIDALQNSLNALQNKIGNVLADNLNVTTNGTITISPTKLFSYNVIEIDLLYLDLTAQSEERKTVLCTKTSSAIHYGFCGSLAFDENGAIYVSMRHDSSNNPNEVTVENAKVIQSGNTNVAYIKRIVGVV